MNSNTLVAILLVCSCVAFVANAAPTPEASPKEAADYTASTDTKDIKKRRIFEENPDAELKQVALSSLIEQLENSLFRSAVSVSGVAHNAAAQVPHVVPGSDAATKVKRETVAKAEPETSTATAPITDAITTTSTNTAASTTTAASTPTPVTPQTQHATADEHGTAVLLQTTAKVPEKDGVPAHILIDRIAVHPHFGGLPLVPAFQIQQTKLTTIKEVDTSNNSSKISITKTAYQAVGGSAASVVEAKKEEVTTEVAPVDGSSTTLKASEEASSTTTPASSTSTTESAKDVKEAEDELKEKVAEIEAEPVILSARV